MCKNPFIPYGKASIAIVDGRISYEIKENLIKHGLEVIKTCKCEELYDSISYHPDIVIHPINYNKVIVAPNVYDYYSDILSIYDIEVIKGEKKLSRNYPENIAYNVARISKYAVHNTKYTDEKLKFYMAKEGIDFINVKQGYSKCSLAIIGEDIGITSDPSIYKELKKHSIDVLLVEEGFIELPGLNYGFIGGATGMLSKDELLLSGSIQKHPSLNKINGFLKKYKIKPIYLSNNRMIDIGSIITF
ncbi:DUF6873 family GME fold protein [Proteiniborus sp. MB09-C3]|uniref:DUF6873 family GME fold protein n=1 Tax=Proteiniborus sp. MB09-C3 TaxID=3050072 RepID=UPI0025547F59|nr:hypothetical protein [Proteiniborus sp. MB09-C3]WIV11414.1 hypothetical protein QO263_15115 [Proteiniborus sp. MB09-C3]